MKKWNLEYLFKTEDDFYKSLDKVNELIDLIGNYQGKLDDEKSFCDFFSLNKEVENEVMRAYQYASLSSDLNKKDVHALENLSKCQNTYVKLVQQSSFLEPELLSLGRDKIIGYINKNQELEEYRFYIEKLFRMQEHVLDSKSEALLSNYISLLDQGGELYSSLSVGDGKSTTITLENNEEVEVNDSNFRTLISEASSAVDRKNIFEAVYKNYEEHKNTYANIYNTVLLADKASFKARNYNSSLEAHLFGNNIPTSVYTNLVDVARTKNAALKKYIRLRKDYLGIEDYHTYDRFIELSKVTSKYTYEEAKEVFFKSIEKFPEDFKNMAHIALEDGFVDVYPQDGKRTGAYSSSMPDLRPYILLNFNNTLDDVFTLAHECGHSIHSLYSMEAQPSSLQNYTIFVAEIASTFNEHNLLDYFMQDQNVSKEVKISLLQKAIDNIMSTFYRQALFADYEKRAHDLIENNQPINYQVLNSIMTELYKEYYDIDLSNERYKEFVWAYIPHLFYTPFYVYQYATSFAASFKLYKDVSENVPGAFERYVGLLKSGGSKYPIDEALEAGVDFTHEETFMAVVDRMEYLVDELEKLLK